ncbi:MAG: hypothetical protein U9R38_05965 [Candidatus Margulisiibacteriota bacterium]|nr:hypothetical protein [Candidatus Margulisiibacteriota bacterium]
MSKRHSKSSRLSGIKKTRAKPKIQMDDDLTRTFIKKTEGKLQKRVPGTKWKVA